jgi:hypothetical protein
MLVFWGISSVFEVGEMVEKDWKIYFELKITVFKQTIEFSGLQNELRNVRKNWPMYIVPMYL